LRKRQGLIIGGLAALTFTCAAAGALAFNRLEAYVDQLILSKTPRPTFHFVDLPEPVASLAGVDLQNALEDVRQRPWLDDALCADIASRVEKLGWVESLRYVRRLSGGRFEVSANYRRPAALVQQGSDFVLVDWNAVRLPGTYVFHPMWKLVQGVAGSAPPPGQPWAGVDLKTGLDVLAAIRGEPYANQVTAVLVNNHRGRENPRSPHIALATDRPGGRILWGSAPGYEVEENTVPQKLTILRENFRRTGRADADYLVIDITTFPDRFVVPE
jgi:hypothetical protein